MTEPRERLFNAQSLGHGWTVAAVLAICGGIFAIAYGAVQAGLAEPVSTFMTAFLITISRLILGGRGAGAKSFAATNKILSAFVADFERWKTESPLIRKCLIAISYATTFLICKSAVTWLFHTLANPWIAGGIGAIFASIILSPILWRAMREKVTNNG